MKTLEIEIALMKYFEFTKNIVVPGVIGSFSMPVKFETDIVSLTKSGYATGVEIKVSKSDLKKDLTKPHQKDFSAINKYEESMSNKEFYFGCYKHFYYAIPEYLIEDALSQIPEWAGLLVVHKHDEDQSTYVKVQRNPAHLYSKKWSDQDMLKLAKLGTMRIFNLKQRILNQVA